LCYYEHPDYVPLLKRAYELWGELERASGAKLLHLTGGLYMGPRGSEVVEGSLRAAREHGLPHEELSQAEIARRYPQFKLPEDHRAIFEPMGGFLLSERIIGLHLELALRHGARVLPHAPVESWRADGAGVEVQTARGVHRAKRLIITAGAWAQRVIGDRRVRVTPTRQVMGWVWPRRPELFELGRLPVWAIDAPGEGMYYGFPMMPAWEGSPPGLKVARHRAGEVTDADRLDRRAMPDDEEDFRPALRRYLPDANGPVVGMRVCMYENSPDGHFIIDRHPDFENVYIAAGFSGHGFKFASVVGEMLVDAATAGGVGVIKPFLRLGRFVE
jgi:sarcosine oxidase